MTSDTRGISLRLFGPLRDAVGAKEVCLPCTEGTVEDALRSFAEEQGQRVRRFIFDEHGNQWQSVILLVNEEPVADARQQRVRPGDVITVLLPMAGG